MQVMNTELPVPCRIPEFLDASGYASALNQALVNDGGTARFHDTEITRFDDGSSPYLYPNVNWIDEGMRDLGASNVFNLSFQEIATAVRYFGVLNFYNEQGLLGPVDLNDGYSTQISNYKINLRTNVEVDLTRSTKLTARIAGNIGVWSRPSTSTSESYLITALYSTPAAAFPVKTYNNVWGGTTTFPNNPMAMITDIGHTERGQNELMIDLLVTQGLSKFIKGLSVDLGISLDNAYHFQDVWSRQYQYNQVSPVVDASGAVVDTTDALYGTNTSMVFSTSVPYQWRRFTGMLISSTRFPGEIISLIQCYYSRANN